MARHLRQIALDLTEDLLARLDATATATDHDKAVHDVRKRLKELRALTGLLRRRLPERGRRDRDVFRDAGRRLASTRDAKAAVEAFDELREHYAAEWTPRRFLKIRRELSHRLASAVESHAPGAIASALLGERRRIAAWPVDEMRQDELWAAIRRSYRRSRRAMTAALEQRSPALFHEWRKRVKAHWHQTELLTDTGLARLSDSAKALHKLSDVLGSHHDLVVIDAVIRQSPQAFGAPFYVASFLEFVSRRMTKLQEKAEEIGRELFSDKPRVWEEKARATTLRRGPKKAVRRTGLVDVTNASTA